jgi:hypothetical protein
MKSHPGFKAHPAKQWQSSARTIEVVKVIGYGLSPTAA